MYNTFARYYDAFTENAEYAARAAYLSELIEQYGIGKGILLDLACGTGTLSFELEQLGFDVIGTDNSEQMLDEALAKKQERGSAAMFLAQDMTHLDLYGTVVATVCTLDSINHLESGEQVQKAFELVSLFTEPGGVFIFDVNTRYKHREVLSNNCFVYENEDCFLVWQNEPGEDDSVDMYLDMFIREGEHYVRESEWIREYCYSEEFLKDAARSAGFEVVAVLDDMSFEAPAPTSQRIVFVCKKAK